MDIPQTLKENLAARRVIPFVGAGVSMAVRRKGTEERLFSSWTELLNHTADRLGHESKQSDSEFIRAGLKRSKPDNLYLAKCAKDALGGAIWTSFLKEEFNHGRDSILDESLALPQLIWQLGSRLIITTNYDKVLRWASPIESDCEIWNIEHKAELAQFLGRQESEKPTIWHLHGSIEDASRIILTQDGYNLLYSDDSTKPLYEAALHSLRSVLSSHTVLFIGCSFNDDHLGLQLQGIGRIFDGCTGPHYALVREDDKARLIDLKVPVEPLTFSEYGQPLLDRLEELTRKVSGLPTPPITIATVPTAAGVTVTVAPARPRYHPSNPVFHVPFAQKGSQVIGRDDALAKVRQQLEEGRRTAIGHTASFQGLGGLGKTQLAVEYAYQFRDSYPNGVIWLQADQDIDAQLTELAVKAEWIALDSEHKDKLDVAKQRLRSHVSCLIIFDNLEDLEKIRPYLPSPVVLSHILITSRTDHPGFTPIPLDPLDPERSLELLYQDACRNTDDQAEEFAAQEIVTILGGLPLAIELAGAYLCHRRTFTFADYLTRLKGDPLKALTERYLSSFTGHDPDLYRTLKINEELFAEEPLLIPILDLLTWGGPASMGIELMAYLLLITQTELSGVLALGVELRIIQKSPDIDRYAIHRLVREVRKVESPLPGRMDWVEKIAAKLGDWFQALREDFKYLPRFEAEIDHLIAWCDNVHGLPLLNARLTWLQAYPPFHRGNYQRAHEIVKLALAMVGEDSKEPNALNAHIFNDFGQTLELIGDNRNSLRYKCQALTIRKELFGDDHPDTASSYNNVGGTYGVLGNYHKALEFQKKALDIRQALFGDDHPETANSYNNVGGTYGALGEYKKALEFQLKALNVCRAIFGDNHPHTAYSYNSVGSYYRALGDLTKALEFQQKAFDIRRALFGDDHPDTAASYNNVGGIYRALGDHAKAMEFQNKSLDICRALLGDNHPHTATSYNNVGGTYGKLGDLKKALEFQQKALDIRRTLFGDDHPETATTYNNVGTAYGALGDYKTALEFQQKALDICRTIFGDDHPDTATSYNNVGATYGELGDHKKALEFKQKALNIRSALFGDHHPDIINSLDNIGATLFNLGKAKIAAEALRKAIDIGKRILPGNHPTIARMENDLRKVRSNTKGFRAVPKNNKRR